MPLNYDEITQFLEFSKNSKIMIKFIHIPYIIYINLKNDYYYIIQSKTYFK